MQHTNFISTWELSLHYCGSTFHTISPNHRTISTDSSPTASTFLKPTLTFSPLVPTQFLSFPCVPVNLFPLRSFTQGLSVPIKAGWCSPPGSHTLNTQPPPPTSLSLYQLGINLLKQRACWQAAHHRPCEELPPHRLSLLPISRTLCSANLFLTELLQHTVLLSLMLASKHSQSLKHGQGSYKRTSLI